MKSMFKFFSVITAAAVLLSCSVGCNDKESEQNTAGDIKEEALPFGSTLVSLDPDTNSNVKIAIDYDDRFITEEEAIKLSDYVAALNSCDTELMEKTIYPPYLSFLAESNGFSTNTEYVQGIYNTIEQNYTGEGFDFNYIVIDELFDVNSEEESDSFSAIDSRLKTLNDGDAAPKISSRKMVAIDIYYSIDDTGSYQFSKRFGDDLYLFLYEIDGETYILS